MTAEVIADLKMPKGSRLVSAIGMSCNDRYLAAVDMADKISVHLFNIKDSKKPIADAIINQKVLHLSFHPTNHDIFSTCGNKHVMFFDFSIKDKKASLSSKKGMVKGGNIASQSSIAYSRRTSSIFTGGVDGKIYIWMSGANLK